MRKQFPVTKHAQLRVNAGWKSYLSFPVDTDDARRCLVWSRDKDGLSTDAVHVDAGTRLQVIQVDVAILGDQENHIVLSADL